MVAGAVNIENWIPKYILGYILYMTFMIIIISNMTVVNPDIYDITPEQQEVLLSPTGDPLTFLNKAVILSSVSSGFAVLSVVTAVLTLGFALAVAKALKEIIPVFPS